MSDFLKLARAATAKAEADAKRIAEPFEVRRLKTKISSATRRLSALIQATTPAKNNLDRAQAAR